MRYKIIRILAKIIVGFILCYLILGFIFTPLALVWGIPNQGAKYLKHPVLVRWVTFNPILLQLNIEGLQVLDQQHELMAGFDKLSIRVNFIDLFKKIIHVESIELDGLNLNPVLLANGRINFLDLIPPQSPAKAPSKTRASSAASPLPKIRIDHIILHNGKVHFVDQSIKPNFSTQISHIELVIEPLSSNPQDETRISLKANLDEKGKISIQCLLKPLVQPIQLETTVVLNGYVLDVLSPYVGKYTGHQLKEGSLDFRMDYKIGGNELNAQHSILIQHFEFGKNVESKDVLHLPFNLALALLEDPQGRIKIALPIAGNLKDPQFAYFPLVGQVARNFLLKLVTKPFTFLASMLGGNESSTDELSYVRFTPGKMDLSEHEKKKLSLLVKGLKVRPKLSLAINGGYDPQADWKAIQEEMFYKDFAQLRKTSTRTDAKIYQQLYQRHFGIRALWTLAKKYKESVGVYEDNLLNKEIKRQLIENAPADQNALEVLAQGRSQMVYNYFASAGFNTKRLSIGQSNASQSSMGFVPSAFTLTVYR